MRGRGPSAGSTEARRAARRRGQTFGELVRRAIEREVRRRARSVTPGRSSFWDDVPDDAGRVVNGTADLAGRVDERVYGPLRPR